ncbi:hypothetical protein K1719_044176 [Acacia pycnantha]|nr:hypothetical protein K1719_044176 [Acacia pycnantha]
MNCEMHVLVVQNPPLISSLSDIRIISSSNGLLCVETDTFSYILWNPVTREVRQIPRTRTLKFPEWACTTGFGFSAIIDDYKIVKTYARHNAIAEVEVYSLNTGSWKEIEIGSLEGVNLFKRTVTANGTIFWDGLKRMQEEGQDDIYVIISFHIAMEVFTLIPGPPLSNIIFLILR